MSRLIEATTRSSAPVGRVPARRPRAFPPPQGVGNEQHRPSWPRAFDGEQARHLQQHRGAHRVVERAVVDPVSLTRGRHADVVGMRGE